jgi:hypothetical protein
MSSYLNNLLTNTTSRYTNLRRQLLSDENDGDTEEDSHISRVLRAYYTEKARPYPQWLPPDPRAPQPQPAQQQFVSSAGRVQGQGAPVGRGGGLSDLWDNPGPQQQAQQPLSLRRGAGGGAAGRPLQGRMGNSLTPEPQGQGRPLPSQRAGSYQSSMGRGAADPSPPPSAGSGTTREAQAATVGSRQIDKPSAKHFLCGIRTTSERLLRATCTRRPCAVPRRSYLLIRQWWWRWWQAASLVWRLRSLRTLQLRRRTTAWRTRRRTRWPAERATHALSFFVHIAMAHLELYGIHRVGCCIVCDLAAWRLGLLTGFAAISRQLQIESNT